MLETDFYQLSMASAAYEEAQTDPESPFHRLCHFELSFRSNPFAGGYGIFCGLESVLDWVESWGFSEQELDYLSQLKVADRTLFSSGFIEFLKGSKCQLTIEAFEEGEICFGGEPILTASGPMWQCLIAETPILNLVGYQTLIATKANRIRFAAKDDQVLEFGLRRAQGLDAGLLASRSAYVGGVDATSNVHAGLKYAIPVRGTHSHAWVMAHKSERDAFDAFARNFKGPVSLLVDTYQTQAGVQKAAQVLSGVSEDRPKSIRLDSGDLAFLSQQARAELDRIGLTAVGIVASNDLDEHLIESLKTQGARIDTWGVGTRLVTGGEQSALGAVYKLSALQEDSGAWAPKIKVSDNRAKTSLPGRHHVFRAESGGLMYGDLIVDRDSDLPARQIQELVDPNDETKKKKLLSTDSQPLSLRPLLLEQVSAGKRLAPRLGPAESVLQARSRASERIRGLHPTIRRLVNPHVYPVGVSMDLFRRRRDMILGVRS